MALAVTQISNRTQKRSLSRSTITDIQAATTVDVYEINVAGLAQLFVQATVDTQALDAFTVSGKAAGATTYVSLYTAITSTPGGLIIAASGTLASLSAASGWFVMNVQGMDSVKISGSAAVNGANLIIDGSAA